MGRPSKITKAAKPLTPSQRLTEIGIDAICDEIAQGKSLHAWCLENGMKNMTVTDWINADKDRAVKYARARDERSDAYFESLGTVSDQAVMAETAVEVAGLRLKADNIKWMLARMSPRKYGDKLAIGGADDLPPVQQEITAAMTQQDAARAYADLMRGK